MLNELLPAASRSLVFKCEFNGAAAHRGHLDIGSDEI
jgi:hypothetical protein